MPFKENGFLGQDGDKFVIEHKHKFAHYFDLSRKANKLAHDILASVQPRQGVLISGNAAQP